MSIAAEELKLYNASVNGRLSSSQVVHDVKNAAYADISEAQLTAGVTVNEKLHFKIANDADTQAVNAKTFIADYTPGGGRAVIIAGTQRNVAADLTGSERNYGATRLVADITAGDTSFSVDAEPDNGANIIIQAGDQIRISNGTEKEFATIDTAVWTVDRCAITTTTALENNYLSATPTTISSCIYSSTLECSTDNWVESSASGTYDESTYPVANDNLGGIEETWTLTFTSATDFSMVGDTVGSVGSGSVAGDFSPSNADFAKPYFSLLAAGWSGTWATNDTIVFQTHPATQPFFCDLIIDPGTSDYSIDNIQFGLHVGSA